jgi:hypothetical protein
MKVLKLDMAIRDSNAREWVAVAIFATVAIILSIWGLVEYNNQNKNQKDYSISLAGHSTFSNNYITALVDSSQIIKVYGLNNESGQDRILLTSMFGKTKDIDSSNVRYQVYPKTSQSLAEPIGVKLEISNTERGLFEGLIMVLQMGNNTIISIPITLTSDTVTNFAVLWI